MLTAFHDEDYKLTAFGELADGYLEKPFCLALHREVVIKTIFQSSGTLQVLPMEEACGFWELYRRPPAGQAISMD